MPGEAPLLSDEWRTPAGLGSAMAEAAGVPSFDLDPFSPHHGYTGIPAKQRINWKQDAYKTTPGGIINSIGFNVPFTEPRKALERIAVFAEPNRATLIGIVRSDTSVAWWHDCIVDSGLYTWCVFTPRISFCTMEGTMTKITPSGGVAIIGNGDATPVFEYVKKTHKRAMWARF
jgi:hypothetical protein